jgi:hypothetical protein
MTSVEFTAYWIFCIHLCIEIARKMFEETQFVASLYVQPEAEGAQAK